MNSVSGVHIPGKSSVDVTTVILKNSSIFVLPKNLNTWFVNYKALTIIDSAVFPGFHRSDLVEFTRLTSLYVRNLPLVRRIPKDSFWDLDMLVDMFLEEMPLMDSLDGDLLINAKSLEVFSARGPNRITQINPGFFRNQARTLRIVDFRDTKLVRIGFTVFQDLVQLTAGRFHNAGCLNHLYDVDISSMLSADIRRRCQDVTAINNVISKVSSSSSDSSE